MDKNFVICSNKNRTIFDMGDFYYVYIPLNK
jgi:hypothetical protein